MLGVFDQRLVAEDVFLYSGDHVESKRDPPILFSTS